MPAAEASHLKRILAAAGGAKGMIRGLLDFAQLGQRMIEKAPVDLNQMMVAARAVLAHEAASRPITWRIGPLPVVRDDAALLRLAFINLLSNGMKYSRTRQQPSIDIGGLPWVVVHDQYPGNRPRA